MSKVEHDKFQKEYHEKEEFYNILIGKTDKSPEALKLVTLMDIAWSLRNIAIALMENNGYYTEYSERYIDGNFKGSKADKRKRTYQKPTDDSESESSS